jgi:hypothetical protein
LIGFLLEKGLGLIADHFRAQVADPREKEAVPQMLVQGLQTNENLVAAELLVLAAEGGKV